MREEVPYYWSSITEEYDPKSRSQTDRGDAKRSVLEAGLREGDARIPESPFSLEKLGKRVGLRSLRRNSKY